MLTKTLFNSIPSSHIHFEFYFYNTFLTFAMNKIIISNSEIVRDKKNYDRVWTVE